MVKLSFSDCGFKCLQIIHDQKLKTSKSENLHPQGIKSFYSRELKLFSDFISPIFLLLTSLVGDGQESIADPFTPHAAARS
jgi:hypothetical protein